MAITVEYESEEELVLSFEKLISKPRNKLNIKGFAKEFNYLSGKTDIIAIDKNKNIVAIEAKLRRWKIAIQQAHKNTSFSHYSFVLLPYDIAMIAIGNLTDFHRRGIGLVSIVNGKLQILIEPKFHAPARPWLTDSAIELVEGT